MLIEERIAMLEAELRELKKKPGYTTSFYQTAAHNCDAYFNGVKAEEQHYGAKMVCEQVARAAFKEKHIPIGNGKRMPCQYIQSEEDADEYFALFKAFLAVYQGYLQKGERPCEKAG